MTGLLSVGGARISEVGRDSEYQIDFYRTEYSQRLPSVRSTPLSLSRLTRPTTPNGYNHLSRLQRRARSPSHHLSRPERAVRALRRLYLSLLSSPMVCPRFTSFTQHSRTA